jgi:hypothetical protein
MGFENEADQSFGRLRHSMNGGPSGHARFRKVVDRRAVATAGHFSCGERVRLKGTGLGKFRDETEQNKARVCSTFLEQFLIAMPQTF